MLTKMLGSGSFGQTLAILKQFNFFATSKLRDRDDGVQLRIYIAKDSHFSDREVALKLEVKERGRFIKNCQATLCSSGDWRNELQVNFSNTKDD